MTASEIREKYLQFFELKNHKRIPSASLVPANDPTVLFTTAGMHPLVPFLMGTAHPEGKRLVNVQKCLRTDDIDEVGDETHLTFFQMLGNWSLGDPARHASQGEAGGYWKNDSIAWSYEFLTGQQWLGIPASKLAFTVFAGDGDAPRDQESEEIWKRLGVSADRIAYLGKEDNWWGPPGVTGPCGPDTEMFFWTGTESAPAQFDPADKRWVEIWNNVFMQYEKTEAGEFVPLKQKNVDTGMGLERITLALSGKDNVYDTDIFENIMAKIRILAVKPNLKSERIIADHLRAAVFLLADGVAPSNKDRGYILRRLIRRAVTHGQALGIERDFTWDVAEVVIRQYESLYPELRNSIVEAELKAEELKFRKTLAKGLKLLESLGEVDGKQAFDLFQTYGFPFELTREFAVVKNIEEFEQEFKKHQELSRTASSGQFRGGLASHSEKTVRLHTATHLMNAALKKTLGAHVMQKGSNITDERTRFDFVHDAKMTPEQKREVEELVNDWISRDLSVRQDILSRDEAYAQGVTGAFGEKYPETVSVYTIYDPQSGEVVSREFCGGPHVDHTGVIGKFEIQKEEAVSAGVRRIKAIIN